MNYLIRVEITQYWILKIIFNIVGVVGGKAVNETISRRITNLGFIMTCLIITYHVGTPSNPLNALDDKWNTYIGNIFNSLASLAISYFFTVTAFLLFNNLSMKNFKQKLQKRMYSLLVPYILWQVIIVIKQIFQGKVWNIKAFIKYTFLFEAWPADGALWYVYAVFLLMLISPFLL